MAAGLRKILEIFNGTLVISVVSHSKISLISKLKYVGVRTADLLDIFQLFGRRRAEYMSVTWHSSLKVAETKIIENIYIVQFYT